MSATATADADAAPKGGGKKKLIVMLVAVLLLAGGAGGGALFWMKSKQAAAAAAEGEEDDAPPAKAHASKHDDKTVPTFVPLDPFTVNLADREVERYAQIGITLELDDPKLGDKIKAYMPAIRNNILLLLSQKTAADLQGREGKEKTALQIQREASRALGADVPDEEEEEEAHAKPAANDEAAGEAKPKKKKKKRRSAEPLPVSRVHFSNFIIQ